MARRHNKNEHVPRQFHLETLEQRMLFSAEAALAVPDMVSAAVTGLAMLQQTYNSEDAARESILAGEVEVRELVFVNSELPDLHMLLGDYNRSARESTQVVVLDEKTRMMMNSGMKRIYQMTQVIARRL